MEYLIGAIFIVFILLWAKVKIFSEEPWEKENHFISDDGTWYVVIVSSELPKANEYHDIKKKDGSIKTVRIYEHIYSNGNKHAFSFFNA